MQWFIQADKPFQGMEINLLSEEIPTHEYESQVFSYRMAVRPKPLSASRVTVKLVPSGDGTLMTYTEQDAYFDGADSGQGREEGTRQLLAKLADEL